MATATKPKRKPITAGQTTYAVSAGASSLTQRVAAMNRFRESYNPLRGLVMQRAVQLAEAYFRGDMADLQWTYFFIEQTDADLLALLELRFGRLLEMEMNVKVVKDAKEAAGKAQAEFLREKIDAIDNLYDAIEHLGMASFRGFAHCEKWYNADGDLHHLEVVDQWNVLRDGLCGPWKYNPQALSTTFAALPESAIMPPEQFLFRQVRRPINRIGLFKFIRANLSEKDWDGFIEIYGIPGGVLIGPPNVPDDQAAEWEAAAQKIAEGGTGFSPNGSDWKPNTAARGSQPFKERLDHLSEKLVLAGTGGKLTMLASPTGIGSGASDVHSDVFDTIAAAEARRISEIFNKQLVAEWIEEGFPGQPALAYLELAAHEETDTTAVISEIKSLAEAGFQVAPEEVSERTGYTVTIKEPAAAPGVPSGPGGRFFNRRRIRNRDAAIATDLLFRADALKQLSAAQALALKPLTDRVLAAADITDDAAFDAAVAKLQGDFPEIQKQIMAKDVTEQLAGVWEKILGPALLSGAVTAAEDRN